MTPIVTSRGGSRVRECRCSRFVKDAFLCGVCVGSLRSLLARVPGLLADLRVTAARLDHVVSVSSVRSRVSGRPLPVNFDAVQAAAELVRAVGVWRPGNARLIARRLDAVAVFDRVEAAVLNGLAVVDLPPELVHVGACGAFWEGQECFQELFVAADASQVACEVCGRVWGVQERKDNALRSAWNVLAPARVVVEALRSQCVMITTKSLQNWEQLGHVSRLCDVESRVCGYRVADVYAVAQRMAARRRKSA